MVTNLWRHGGDQRSSCGAHRGEVINGLLRGKGIPKDMDANVDPTSLTLRRAITAELAKCACLPPPSLQASRGILDSRKPFEQLFEAERAIVYDAEARGMI